MLTCARTLHPQHSHRTAADMVSHPTPGGAPTARSLAQLRLRGLLRAGLCAAVLALTLHPAIAQERAMKTADLVGKPAAARRLLFTVGHWASQDDGTFYFQFRSNGTYTYTHIDTGKVTRVQQAGRFDVRSASLSDERWPGVAAPDVDARKNRSFELRLYPAAVEVSSSDPQGLPDDQPGDYRLTITLPDVGTPGTPTFTVLSETLPPDSTFGRLTFKPGP